ncbi:MAG: redoxin domain-containing protein [Parafilimonas sp.]|nr:redoxin domain-containing protein [Parafilimonas sp.]
MIKSIINYIALLLVVVTPCTLKAQTKPVSKTFPVFNLRLADSSLFKSSSIKKGEPVVVIYFSPTCEHCQVFISDILKNMQSFKNEKFILVTYLGVDEVKKFENDYHLKNYKNIIAGTEGFNFTVKNFYDVGPFPFTAAYDKNLNLKTIYRKPPSMDQLKSL